MNEPKIRHYPNDAEPEKGGVYEAEVQDVDGEIFNLRGATEDEVKVAAQMMMSKNGTQQS